MLKNKSERLTVFLIVATVFLLGAVFYISGLITSDEEEKSSVAPRQTKAASVTYSKLIAFNQDLPGLTATAEPTVVTPTAEAKITETVLAYSNPSVTQGATVEAGLTGSLSPTKVKNIPDAGFIYNGLVIFIAAGVLVFFSFLF